MIALADPPIHRNVEDASDFRDCLSAFRPTPLIGLLEWCQANIFNEHKQPYDQASYPHLGAPGGPMDAFDDPGVRTISLQWGSRLGKTFFGQCAQLHIADTKPGPQMFASSVEQLCKDVMKRTYKVIAQSQRLDGMMLRRHDADRRNTLIEFKSCEIVGAWSRGTSTLADKDIKIGHANEIDKWEHESTSTEADPLKLFDDRFKNFDPSKKIIYESTPTIYGKSRIETLRLQGTNCTLQVPCPHCRKYQKLEMGTGEDGSHGLRWEKPDNGRSDAELARRTAWYQCKHCPGKITDRERNWMLRRGAWVPEGCTIRDEDALSAAESRLRSATELKWSGWATAAWIEGRPARDGVAASYHLSSLYAIKLTWGALAKEFIESKSNPQRRRNWVNQWLAETWRIIAREQNWETVGKRLICNVPRGVVPAWAVLVTAGIDKQGEHYVYVFDAWGPGRRSHTLEYGRCVELEELRKKLSQEWPAESGTDGDNVGADAGKSGELAAVQVFTTSFALMDAGYRQSVVLAFCKECRRGGIRILPSKGSSRNLDSFYVKKTLGKNSSAPGQHLVFIDTNNTQEFIDQQLHVLSPSDQGAATLFAGSLAEHQDFLEQVLNDAPVSDLDASNNPRESWKRIDVSIPNDYRDCRRNSLAAMLMRTRGAPLTASVAENRGRRGQRRRGGSRQQSQRPMQRQFSPLPIAVGFDLSNLKPSSLKFPLTPLQAAQLRPSQIQPQNDKDS